MRRALDGVFLLSVADGTDSIEAYIMRIPTVATVLLLCIAPVVLHAQTPTVRAEVQAFVKSYAQTANAGDISGHMELYSREASLTSIDDGAILRGWDAIRTQADSVTGQEGSFHFALGSIDVTPLGAGYALAVAPFVATIATEEGTVERRGALTLILKKTSSGWLIVHDHTSTQPDDAGTPE